MFKSTTPISLHDTAVPIQNLVDDEVFNAATVLFGQPFINLRNLSYPQFPTTNPDETLPQSNDSERSSSPDELEDELAAIRRFAGSVIAISQGRRKRKAPKRYDPGEDEEKASHSNSPKVKGGKAKNFIEIPGPSQSSGTEDDSHGESSSEYFIRAVGRMDTDEDDIEKKPVRPRAVTKKSSRRCDYCGATTTPMWRHGPVGYDDLCNRCGVKWMRGRILGNLTRAS